MSVHGVRGPYTSPAPQPAHPRPTDAARNGRVPAAAPAAAPVAPSSAPATSSVTPPPGTDPELWTVLTPDERAYFARLGAMGPLTYGRVLTADRPGTPAAARGVRLDVKA